MSDAREADVVATPTASKSVSATLISKHIVNMD